MNRLRGALIAALLGALVASSGPSSSVRLSAGTFLPFQKGLSWRG
jgi:hypothetical protein